MENAIRSARSQMTAAETDASEALESKFEIFMDQLVAQQQEKVLQIARSAKSNLTPEDILNPQDYPALMSHPTFNYEEGLLTGLMAAQVGLRSHLFRNQNTSRKISEEI